MAVNKHGIYVPKPESGAKVLKMTPPWNDRVDIALTSEKESLSEVLIVAFRSGHWKEKFV
jgi:hypothetical protein